MSDTPPGRPRRSVGTATPTDVLRRGFRSPSQERLAADLAAVDEGVTLRVASLFRGTYGNYPKRFGPYLLDLTPLAILARPPWNSLSRRKFRMAEDILDAHVRPRNARTDWNIRATGLYASDGALSYAGFEVISCRTNGGTIEFAVPRPDVPLMLHFISRLGSSARSASS